MARFGEYELLERIAVGGMAEIFKAKIRRPGGIGKILCIKRVHPKYCADASFRQMFIEEARIGVSLSHGNIVPVFDFGSIDGLYYLAMEYVEGRDLAQIAGRARLVGLPCSREVAIYLVSELLEGLHYAHERSEENGQPLHIVHRDVSPSNLLVSKAGEVKILDFGIARAEIREYETRTGVVKGTPGYMAPEQRLGSKPDRRVDVYGAGVILWELLQNKRFPADEEGSAPSVDDPELDAILARSISDDPGKRFKTAREMKEALQALLLARGQQPGPADLAEYVERLLETPAGEEDWRYRKSEPPPEGSEPPAGRRQSIPPATRPIGRSGAPPLPAAPQTEQIPQTGVARRRAALIGLALLGVAGAATAAVVGQGLGDDPATARPRPRPTALQRGAVEILSRPTGAEVELDDEVVGKTPYSRRDLELGEHVVRFTLEGYRPLEKVFTARAGRTQPVDGVLEPLLGGFTIETVPPGAAIEVDGSPRGQAPVTLVDLRPGPHRIRATLPGRPPAERELRVVADRVPLFQIPVPEAPVAPPAAPARLSVNTQTGWGQVFVDGRFIGNTPVVNRSFPAGVYQVVVKNPGGREIRQRVVLRAGETKPLTLEWPEE